MLTNTQDYSIKSYSEKQPELQNVQQVEIQNTNQRVPRTPMSPSELAIRVQYALDLLSDANQLKISEASQDKINEAYKKAERVQKGLYYYDDTTNMAKELLKKDIAYFNQNTGVLTVSQKDAKNYQVGQKLPFNANVYERADRIQSRLYCWDKKTNTAKELPQRNQIVHFDVEKPMLTYYDRKVEKQYYIGPRFPSDDKAGIVFFFLIAKINSLTKGEMEKFVNDLYKPGILLRKLFHISEEKLAIETHQKTMGKIQIQGQKIQLKNQINQDIDLPPLLKKWQDESRIDPTIEEIANADPNNAKDAIYIFGKYNSSPTHGIYDKTRKLPGQYLALNKKNLEDLGRTEKNNFLSNAYQKDLVIPGDIKSPYKSVYHYLVYKRIEKSNEAAKNCLPKEDKNVLKSTKQVEKIIKKVSTAYDANFFYLRQTGEYPILPKGLYSMFQDLDEELKKALFYKFVGPDGKPNEEGTKLLETGDVKLYAGYEIGDLNYGMLFVDRNLSTNVRSMEGANKLGKCLMELRQMLREPEKKSQINTNELYVETRNVSSHKPLPQPKSEEYTRVQEIGTLKIRDGLTIKYEAELRDNVKIVEFTEEEKKQLRELIADYQNI